MVIEFNWTQWHQLYLGTGTQIINACWGTFKIISVNSKINHAIDVLGLDIHAMKTSNYKHNL